MTNKLENIILVLLVVKVRESILTSTLLLLLLLVVKTVVLGHLLIFCGENNRTDYDYCSHPDCSLKNQHTMCIAKNIHSPRLFASGVTTWMRFQILLLHNRHRDNIAMGLEAGQPPAANMRKMYWDYELEEMAEIWARQCQKRHDECRNTIRFNVLQNMDVRPVGQRVTEAQLLSDAVGAWFSGSRSLPSDHVWSFKLSNCSSPGGCNAHWYSAATWASTWRIGCSQALCTAKSPSCVKFRKRRTIRNSSEKYLFNATRTTTPENLLRRTKYMTTEKKPGFEGFSGTTEINGRESLLRRGIFELINKVQDKKREETEILAYTFCNYGPAGNIEGFPIYEAGTACTNCPQGSKCNDGSHRGLCTIQGDPDSVN